MKKIMFLAAASFLALQACNSGNGDVEEIEQLRNEAVAIHDEIMPQISAFDRNTLKIDSLLADLPRLQTAYPDLDTAHTRQELSAMKTRLELATDSMMNWMTAFDVDPQDKSTAEIKAYYQQEVKKVKGMQELFNAVSKESTDRLAQF